MGSKALGIFIKTDTKNYNQDSIAKELFGCTEIYNPSDGHLQFGEYLTIMTYENGIELLEPNFVEKFVKKEGVEVNKINKYFNKPEFILAYMIVDGVYAYGFRYMENGETIRFRFRGWDGSMSEKGTPLPEELKYLNAKYFICKEDEEEEEFMAFSFSGNEEKVDGDYAFILETLVEELMISKLGYTYDGAVMGENIAVGMKQYKLPNK